MFCEKNAPVGPPGKILSRRVSGLPCRTVSPLRECGPPEQKRRPLLPADDSAAGKKPHPRARRPAFPEKGAVRPCRPSPHAVARLRVAPGRERAIKPRTSPAAAAPLPAKARRSRRAGAAEGRKGTQRRSPGQDIAVSAYGRHVAGNGEPASDHDTALPLPTQRGAPCSRRRCPHAVARLRAAKSRRRQLRPAQALT